ncbi:alpha/beta fold hydrolase [Litorihabitans aurantiacus]|uniref:Hydrolase n=1 Tax=Litorihabitans aurantiacus TaxID=1930061 RepID=A0AA37XF84_9MICO|nr:alpha/beta fold hydrolase [Litorihabitans aurantiacus]GMA32207.1 hydrolase [Litorihabitans aurantiacus]
MGASGFPSLASHLTDRVVVTYDPRGVERSTRHDGEGELTPQVHAADVAAVIEAVLAEAPAGHPVDLFASSGGAVNALALVASRPDLVRTLVAHEPPLCTVLPDAEPALAAVEQLYATYRADGLGPAMTGFIVLSQHRGEVDGDVLASLPDPAAFWLPTTDDGSRGNALLGQNLRGICGHRPDVDALRAAATRVEVAVGAESAGELAHRAGEALAAALGSAPVVLPGGHGGFLGDEYGMVGEAEPFARRLREVLDRD